jgi:formate dehydrogenase major subunit
MTRRPPQQDVDESKIKVGEPKTYAAGVKGVLVSLQHGWDQMGATRSVRTLRLLNQREGFDCPGCAWPEAQGHRKLAEFCENGAKAVAEEATTRRVGPEFFAAHSVAELGEKTDYWLGQQGRLTEPMVLREGASHYEPISWDDAFTLAGEALRGLADPNEAIFYTSGRTSNEAAFAYQLLARSLGTNNLPDCSNMCHESSGSALIQTIGIGKGSVSLADVTNADLLLVVGQNPGTNHPRMLSALEEAKGNGATIVAVNPLPEAGLMRFKNPQNVRGVVGKGTPLADEFCQIRLGGDLAFFRALGHLVLAAEDAAPGTVLDREFIESSTHGFEEWAADIRQLDWDEVDAATGLPREQIAHVARLLVESKRTIICWAMGLTQHKKSVPTIRELVNVLLLRGMIGKPGAGVCPVRGHSNVQGDRTMGIYEKPKENFLAALDAEFGITSPRAHGYDTVEAIHAMRDGKAKVFFAVGGNFVSATPDTEVTMRALRSMDLTVHVSRSYRPHPAHAGPYRAGRPGRWRPVRHRRGLHVRRAPFTRPALPRQFLSAVRSRDHLAPRPRRLRLFPRRAVGGLRGRLQHHPRPHFPCRSRFLGLQLPRPRARRLRPAPPSAGFPHLPHHHRQGQLHRQPGGAHHRARRPPHPADASQPRPVQHHHLRPRRPLPRRP